MKQRVSPYQFTDYREFLRTSLKAGNYSYRSFAAKHGGLVSYMALAQTLSRGRSGTKNKPTRNLSVELLGRIGKALRLKEDEIAHLMLLKIENDSEVFPGLYGAAHLDAIRGLIRSQKDERGEPTRKEATFSKAAENIAEIFDLLPRATKGQIVKHLIFRGRGVLHRQKPNLGVKALSSVIKKLDTLQSTF